MIDMMKDEMKYKIPPLYSSCVSGRSSKRRSRKFHLTLAGSPSILLLLLLKLVAQVKIIEAAAAASTSEASGPAWLTLAPPKAGISLSELNFDNQTLERIPKFELCDLHEPPRNSTTTTTTNNKPFIHVLNLANNQVKIIESNAFFCIAPTLKILILRYNEIDTIELLAFNQLAQLQVLLLDNNQLSSVPTKEQMKHLVSLRHLNLANNRIESLGSDSFGDSSANLISLNLKGNPLHQLAPDSMWRLAKLKTLMLSQTSLEGQLVALDGLSELRFYHLDRTNNLHSISANLCHSSRHLTTLVLASNQLKQIPQFLHCQSLLLLDLSYNKIAGILANESFLQQPNLIDLYLGHNQIELIAERAFVGLMKLQVLELNNNRLKQIHPQAFLPLQASIYDLNLSNNPRLSSLASSQGLDLLVSFKSYGNEQLKKLPYLKSATSLALTYAYHCCDYLVHSNYSSSSSSSSSFTLADFSSSSSFSSDDIEPKQDDDDGITVREGEGAQNEESFQGSASKEAGASVGEQFVGSIYAKFKSLFSGEPTKQQQRGESASVTATTSMNSHQTTKSVLQQQQQAAADVSERNKNIPRQMEKEPEAEEVAPTIVTKAEQHSRGQNLSEIVLWPASELNKRRQPAAEVDSASSRARDPFFESPWSSSSSSELRKSRHIARERRQLDLKHPQSLEMMLAVNSSSAAVSDDDQWQQSRNDVDDDGGNEVEAAAAGARKTILLNNSVELSSSSLSSPAQQASAVQHLPRHLDVRLIDELLWWQVEEIRRIHSVQLPFDSSSSASASDDDAEASNALLLDNDDDGLRRTVIIDDAIKFLMEPRNYHADNNNNNNNKEHQYGYSNNRAHQQVSSQKLLMMKIKEVPTTTTTSNKRSEIRKQVRHLMIEQEEEESRNFHLTPPTIRTRIVKPLMLVARERRQTSENLMGNQQLKHSKHQHHSQQPVVAPKPLITCLPKPSAFFPCQDLFDTWWLRLGIWCVFLLSFTGNISVIIVLGSVKPSSSASALSSIMWLAHSKRHIDVPRFLVINLAFADLLMALYLGILAFVDLTTLGEFKLFAIKWQYSFGCKLAGFLGVLSSELSVFILAIITLERNYAITNAVHLNRRLSLQKAMIIMLLGYTFALFMALMPLNGISDYRKFSICLPLDVESNLSSQVYVVTLISINTFSFILLLSCYLRMYCAIRGSQAWNTNDLRIAKRMSILVITDFLCWMPIILVAITSFFGYHLIGTKGLKILTIFILPLNSVANPFLYAITTKKFKRDLDTLILRTRSSLAAMNQCNTKQQYNNSSNINSPKLNNQQMFNTSCVKNYKEKVFVDYNQQYQHNIILMNRKKSKKNKVKLQSDELEAKYQPHQQQLASNKMRRKFWVDQKQQQEQQRQLGQTANQVTMNKTTCSCQQQRFMVVEATRDLHQHPVTVNNKIQVEKLDSNDESNLVHVAQMQQPRIVLDFIETNVPTSMPTNTSSPKNYVHKSKSTNLIPATKTNCQQLNQSSQVLSHRPNKEAQQHDMKACSAGALQLHHHDQDGVMYLFIDADSFNEGKMGGKLYTRSHQTTPTTQDNGGRESSSPYNNSYQAQPQSLHKCSGQSVGATCDIKRNSQRYLLVNNQQQSCLQADRSASACGYRKLDADNSLNLDDLSKRKVSGSCDTMQHHRLLGGVEEKKTSHERTNKNNRSSHSRSINKLLFDPIAKAWSSIQISLSSSSTQVVSAKTSDKQQQHATSTIRRLISPTSSIGTNHHHHQIAFSSRETAKIQTTFNEEHSNNNNKKHFNESFNQAHLLDEILMMTNSPTSSSNRYLLRFNERRMSRSCDLISTSSNSTATNKNRHNDPLASPTSTSTYDNQTSTTNNSNLYEYDDDQRILLATIRNCIAHGEKDKVKNRKRDPVCSSLLTKNNSNNNNNNNNNTQSRKGRSNFTRCRSWSPALLNKLEDCIHQIKFKLPAFSTGLAESSQNQQAHEMMYDCQEEDEDNDDDDGENVSAPHSHPTSDDEDNLETNVYKTHERLDAGDQLVDVAGEEDEDVDNDKFNEASLLDWTERKGNMFRRHHYQTLGRAKELASNINYTDKRKRLKKQQSSTNSDTMSTRTGGTILTNITDSFDSSTGIPAQNQNQSNNSSSSDLGDLS